MVKNLPTDSGDIRDMGPIPGLIPGSGRSPGGGHGDPLQRSCLENPHRQRSLVSYSPCGQKKLDTTEQLSMANMMFNIFSYAICYLPISFEVSV